MMDPLSKARFDEITSKDVNDVTEEDTAFLRARASYLSGDQREKFADVLKVSEPEADKPAKAEKK